MTVQTKGVWLAVITAVISGVANYVNKFAVAAIKPPLVFTAVKNSLVGMVIISLLLVSRKRGLIRQLKRNEIIRLIAIAVVGGTVPFYLFFTGLSQIPAVNGALIHKSLVLWVALLAVPFLKEKLSLWQVGAVGLLFSSNLVVGGFKGFQFSQGEMMVLVATLFWAIENVIAKKTLKTVDPDIVTAARMGLGSLILLVAAQLRHPQALAQILTMTSTQWMWMVLTTLILLGYVMSWYRALKLAPAVLVTSVLVLATLVTNLLTAIETKVWNGQMLLQAGIVGVGLVVFWWGAKRSQVGKEMMVKES